MVCEGDKEYDGMRPTAGCSRYLEYVEEVEVPGWAVYPRVSEASVGRFCSWRGFGGVEYLLSSTSLLWGANGWTGNGERRNHG